MAVLILKNIASEGPGRIAGHLEARGIAMTVLEPGAASGIDVLGGYDTLVVLGGPMGVYEMKDYPNLRLAASIMEEALKRGCGVMGVCLGAQLMAHVLGARVYKGEAGEESGWCDIELTPEGSKDPVISALPEGGAAGKAAVLQWHGDTFDIPRGGVRLAGSGLYENQAFRYGERAYALQFHIECTREMIGEWFKVRADRPRIMAATETNYGAYVRAADRAFGRFFH